MTIYQTVVYAHVLAGAVALVMFWIAASLRKGSPRHVAVGRWYLIAMTAVMISATAMASFAFAEGKPVTAAFFAYLVVITAAPCWQAWRAIRDKHDIARFAGPVLRLLAGANVLAGAGILALGIRYGQPLFIGLSLVGLIAGSATLRFAIRPPTDKRWWLVQHFSGIAGAGVATHVAFLGLGLTRLLPPEYVAISRNLGWILPFAISIAARLWFRRRYAITGTATSRGHVTEMA